MDDEWGRDPSVQRMRRIFAAIDSQQKRLLDGAGIHRFDKRLSRWRKAALRLFEQSWSRAAQAGVPFGEKDISDLYLHCLARILCSRGVTIPDRALPVNPAVARIMGDKKPGGGEER